MPAFKAIIGYVCYENLLIYTKKKYSFEVERENTWSNRSITPSTSFTYYLRYFFWTAWFVVMICDIWLAIIISTSFTNSQSLLNCDSVPSEELWIQFPNLFQHPFSIFEYYKHSQTAKKLVAQYHSFLPRVLSIFYPVISSSTVDVWDVLQLMIFLFAKLS